MRRFIKVFRLQVDGPELSKDQHNRNTDAVLREALDAGVQPKAEVEHVSTSLFQETRRGVKTYDVVYQVEVAEVGEAIAAKAIVTPRTNPSKPEARTPAGRAGVARANTKPRQRKRT